MCGARNKRGREKMVFLWLGSEMINMAKFVSLVGAANLRAARLYPWFCSCAGNVNKSPRAYFVISEVLNVVIHI